MSFQIGLNPAEVWAARTIDKVRRAVVDGYLQARKTRKLRKKDIAARLGKDPAQITRWITRPEQLSLKSLGYLAYALDCDVKIELVPLRPTTAVAATINHASLGFEKMVPLPAAGGNMRSETSFGQSVTRSTSTPVSHGVVANTSQLVA